MVKKAKRMLEHIYDATKLSTLEMETALECVAAILNSRTSWAQQMLETGDHTINNKIDHRCGTIGARDDWPQTHILGNNGK